MIYSYTQISHFLACPRRYRYRYLDGWREKETFASLLFGRAFETALAAYFYKEDAEEVLSREWSRWRQTPLAYPAGESWDRMLHQGVVLLQRFSQDDRIHIASPQHHLQLKFSQRLDPHNEFVGYIDAIGSLDGVRSVLDWKTSSRRYTEEPAGVVSLDPQLICYSWLTGISEVALVVFIRKRQPEIQYLSTTITDEQREEFGRLVTHTVQQIERDQFLPHSGIRFPHNSCPGCSYLGLCLKQPPLIDAALIRQPGAASLDWVDELRD
jgi:CRISPR/Cas system-associated exonuclease Cas4 (RecB family)